ncbi:MAG TPA: terminase gpA endonuclease subunit, partial [Pseudoxanthomonas sp.]|nr:terminase gpA endonuclease subunit [Pseudoxanthomonas sp.]
DKPLEARLVHFSEDLPREYFPGLVSEIYNPVKNRFEKKVIRNEPLDTWVYAYAAAHHPELRLHRYTKADWEVLEARLGATPAPAGSCGTPAAPALPPAAQDSRETRTTPRRHSGIGAREGWGL